MAVGARDIVKALLRARGIPQSSKEAQELLRAIKSAKPAEVEQIIAQFVGTKAPGIDPFPGIANEVMAELNPQGRSLPVLDTSYDPSTSPPAGPARRGPTATDIANRQKAMERLKPKNPYEGIERDIRAELRPGPAPEIEAPRGYKSTADVETLQYAAKATPTAADIADRQKAMSKVLSTSQRNIKKFLGNRWPVSGAGVKRLFKKLGMVTEGREIANSVAKAVASKLKTFPSAARGTEEGAKTLAAIAEAVSERVKGGIAASDAIADVFGIVAKAPKGLAAAGSDLVRKAGSLVKSPAVGIAAAFGIPMIAGKVSERIGAERMQQDIATARAGGSSMLPTARDIMDQEQLEYLRQQAMARNMASSGSASALVRMLESQQEQSPPLVSSGAASAGFPG